MAIRFNLIVLLCFLWAYVFFRSLLCFINSKNFNFKNEGINLGLYMSIVAVVAMTLFPIRLDVPFSKFEIFNLIPLKVPISTYLTRGLMYFLYQNVGNLVLFMPFGFFACAKTKCNIKKVVFASLALTLFIEFNQGFIPYRFCEIDDVWLNTLGGFLGSYLYIKFINYFRNLKRDDQS
ncbi:VanZ family protein [Paraclostridium bifermentans]|uniref:VanZ family protein n=1 Tax=Paraclostridium bifermentans TaxID=1490 RepID=UPI0024B9AA30|nr:VanZ family protein [Paraclostridium bifermentans]